jgi:hypothetical protein
MASVFSVFLLDGDSVYEPKHVAKKSIYEECCDWQLFFLYTYKVVKSRF